MSDKDEGNDGEWDFKIEDDDGNVSSDKNKKNDERSKEKRKSTALLMLSGEKVAPRRRSKKSNKDLKLDFDSVPKRSSRKRSNENVEEDDSSRQEIFAVGVASHSQRIKGLVIDGASLILLVFLGNMLIETSKEYVLWAIKEFELSEHLKNFDSEYIITTANFIALYFIVFVLPMMSIRKTFGKVITKTEIEDIDGGLVGGSRVLFRELICKPISMILIIGFILPFYNKKRRSLHDYLTQTYIMTADNNYDR